MVKGTLTGASATGRRKESTARVWLKPGKGDFSLNGKPVRQYVGREDLFMDIKKPLAVTDNEGKYDVVVKATGGGISGQTTATQLGIARALAKIDDGLKLILRKNGLLTRDPRAVERKKYGRVKARKRFQYSKR
ncbi:MAG: 30S ribosomal protein S9 [candidate division Zixibacteria bacterium]|nr:30S ribosomal protein S9 [candidate division Zixibacteria bacterium]